MNKDKQKELIDVRRRELNKAIEEGIDRIVDQSIHTERLMQNEQLEKMKKQVLQMETQMVKREDELQKEASTLRRKVEALQRRVEAKQIEMNTLKSENERLKERIAEAEDYCFTSSPLVVEHVVDKDSEEFRQAVEKAREDAKEELGRSNIGLNTIAQAILNLPTPQMQYEKFLVLNELLTGTVWVTKAKEVMDKIFITMRGQSSSATSEVHNHFDTGSNCQVFNGSASGRFGK